MFFCFVNFLITAAGTAGFRTDSSSLISELKKIASANGLSSLNMSFGQYVNFKSDGTKTNGYKVNNEFYLEHDGGNQYTMHIPK